jgi:RNA polymerase sporulation-specific sigma factor
MNKVCVTGLDTSTLPKLSAKELSALLERISKGDSEARELFIRANMRLVLSLVGRFPRAEENADDMFQVGMVGLIKALNNFDYNLGVCFSTYAVPMIVGEIKRCLRDRTGIKVSRSLRDTAYKALRAREMLEDGNKEPLMEEIAQEIGVSLSEVACALDAVSDTLSFYDPVFGNDVEEGMMLLDQIADQKENSDKWAENIALEEALAIVPEREIQIVKMRYYEGKTQVEISAMTGISQAQVSRLEKSAINRLRRCLCE